MTTIPETTALWLGVFEECGSSTEAVRRLKDALVLTLTDILNETRISPSLFEEAGAAAVEQVAREYAWRDRKFTGVDALIFAVNTVTTVRGARVDDPGGSSTAEVPLTFFLHDTPNRDELEEEIARTWNTFLARNHEISEAQKKELFLEVIRADEEARYAEKPLPVDVVAVEDAGGGRPGNVTVCVMEDPDRGPLVTLEPVGVEMTRAQALAFVEAVPLAVGLMPEEEAGV